MDESSLHELTAAYAVDALDDTDAAAYLEHLRTCASCRNELAQLTHAAAMLAYVPTGATPAPELRDRILGAARAERTNIVPLRPRWALPVGAAAAVAVAATVALTIWAVSLERSLDRQRSAAAEQRRATQILADPQARRVEMSGGQATVIVTNSGDAALVANALPHARSGSVYEAWVIHAGKTAPAGTFVAGAATTVLALQSAVTPGAKVAVTVERAPGAQAPTSAPILQAQT